MTMIGCVYQPKELVETDERKRKGKEVLAEESQKKKTFSSVEAAEFIKTLKRNKYSVV